MPTAAIDGTARESGHPPRCFGSRSGRERTARTWTKLTVACDTASHYPAGATVTTGPSNDSPEFRPVLLLASLAVGWDRVLADAAFDSEAHHAYAREDRGIRSSVIPINTRGHAGEPGGKYRGQMDRRFVPKPDGS